MPPLKRNTKVSAADGVENHTRKRTLPIAVYRMYDADGALLYVGQSQHPESRLGQHRATSDWVFSVTDIKVQWVVTRRDALDVERQAIREEKPRHNIIASSPERKAKARPGSSLIGRGKLALWIYKNFPSQSAAAARIGIAPNFLSEIRTGRRRPSDDVKSMIEAASNGEVAFGDWRIDEEST